MNDQLQVRESQLLNMKHEFGKQEDAIRGLEHSLSVAGKTVDAQKARILRLSARNEELVRLYHSKESEVQDLRVLSSAEAESRKVCEQELVQVNIFKFFFNTKIVLFLTRHDFWPEVCWFCIQQSFPWNLSNTRGLLVGSF